MKTQLIAATALLCLSVTAKAEIILTPTVQDLLVELCMNTQDNEASALRKTLRENRLSKQTAVDKVLCNGQQLIDFARSSEAHKVVAMLTPYERRAKVSVSDVVSP